MLRRRMLAVVLISLLFIGLGGFLIVIGISGPRPISLPQLLLATVGVLMIVSALYTLTFKKIARRIILVVAIINSLWWGALGIIGIISLIIGENNFVYADPTEEPLAAFSLLGLLSVLSLIVLLQSKTRDLFRR